MQGVGPLAIGSGINLLNERIHEGRPELGGTVAQEGVKNLATTHADVGIVVVTQWIQPDVHLLVGGGNHLHVADFSIDDRFGKFEFLDHAERDRSSAGLGVVEFALEYPGADASFCKHFGRAGSTRTSADDGNSQHLSTLRWTLN